MKPAAISSPWARFWPPIPSRRRAPRRCGPSGSRGGLAAYIFLRRAFYDRVEEVALEAVRAAALLGSRQAEGEVAALYSPGRAPDAQARILELALATGERLFALDSGRGRERRGSGAAGDGSARERRSPRPGPLRLGLAPSRPYSSIFW